MPLSPQPPTHISFSSTTNTYLFLLNHQLIPLSPQPPTHTSFSSTTNSYLFLLNNQLMPLSPQPPFSLNSTHGHILVLHARNEEQRSNKAGTYVLYMYPCMHTCGFCSYGTLLCACVECPTPLKKMEEQGLAMQDLICCVYVCMYVCDSCPV